MKKRILSLFLAFVMVFSISSVVFADMHDLTNIVITDGTRDYKYEELLDLDSDAFEYVFEHIDQYIIEAGNGNKYYVSEVNDKLIAGAETFKEAIDGLTPYGESDLSAATEAVEKAEDVTVEKVESGEAREALDAAKELVEALEDSEEKDALVKKLVAAEDAIEEIEAGLAANEKLAEAEAAVAKAEETKTQEDVDAAQELVDELIESDAKDGLVARLDAVQGEIDAAKADLTEYEKALAAVKEEDYTGTSWDAYQEVVDANVVTEENTQEDVDAATVAILEAQKDLEKIIIKDHKQLIAEVNNNENLKDNLIAVKEYFLRDLDITDDFIAKFEMLNTKDSNSLSDINKLMNATRDALQAVKADLTEYEKALAAVKEEDYTGTSWDAYQEVVDANVVTEENTQEDVDAATVAILEAQKDLEKIIIKDYEQLIAEVNNNENLKDNLIAVKEYFLRDLDITDDFIAKFEMLNTKDSKSLSDINKLMNATRDALKTE